MVEGIIKKENAMSELEEVKKELAALQEKVAKIEQAKNEPTKRWKPSRGELYKSILSDASVGCYKNVDDSIDEGRIESSNAFPKNMPLNDIAIIRQFINEMELICWQLGVTSSQEKVAYAIQSNDRKICYRFDAIDQRDKAKSMLSDKVKEWLEIT